MEKTEQIVCNHPKAPECGCWVDSDGKVQRHAFRFLAGDRVIHHTWRGFRGTVQRDTLGGSGLYVIWDEIGLNAHPSSFPAYWDVEHIQD